MIPCENQPDENINAQSTTEECNTSNEQADTEESSVVSEGAVGIHTTPHSDSQPPFEATEKLVADETVMKKSTEEMALEKLTAVTYEAEDGAVAFHVTELVGRINNDIFQHFS